MQVVDFFQDLEGGVNMTQGVARVSRNPVLGCVIPPGSSDLIVCPVVSLSRSIIVP